MIKRILGICIGLILLITTITIFYWKDIQYAPTGFELINYFLIFPVILTLLIISPYLIYKGIKTYKENKQKKIEKEKQTKEQQELEGTQKQKPQKDILITHLNVFSSAALHAFGENENIIESIQKLKSPELDFELKNAYGIPLLSYRISEVNDLIEIDDEQSDQNTNSRVRRIQALIEQQLEQHITVIQNIAEHLQRSAMFYDSELAYQYRMHPAWLNSDSYTDENIDEPVQIQQVPRLNRFNIHIVVTDTLLHELDDIYQTELINKISEHYGIINEQIHFEYHFLNKNTAYYDWLKLLNKLANQKNEVSLLICADSEIDQAWIDEKTWEYENYIASEYVSSWIVADQLTDIENLQPLRTLTIVNNITEIHNYLLEKNIISSNQYENEQPFVLILDEIINRKIMKKIQAMFDQTVIDSHHFLYLMQNLGHTQHLAKVFGLMLGIHFSEDMVSMGYSVDQDSTFLFYHQNQLEESNHSI